MKSSIISILGLAVMTSISLVSPAKAVVDISWTSIGNPGNAADSSTGYGAVSYSYNIGTYEVTSAQYVEFLNSAGASNSYGIYDSYIGSLTNITQSGSSGSYTYSVSSSYANLPVVGVTWFDAARFSNWLQNGQGSGSTETGAYTLSGATSGVILANADAQIRLPTEDEWYKAAYYNGVTGAYSLYANGQNTITQADANYSPSSGLVNVNYGKPSSYGAHIGGNAWEWNDAVIGGTKRGLRGGSWASYVGYLASSYSENDDPSHEGSDVGFRVASVPEPMTGILTIISSGIFLIRRKR